MHTMMLTFVDTCNKTIYTLLTLKQSSTKWFYVQLSFILHLFAGTTTTRQLYASNIGSPFQRAHKSISIWLYSVFVDDKVAWAFFPFFSSSLILFPQFLWSILFFRWFCGNWDTKLYWQHVNTNNYSWCTWEIAQF